MSRFFTVSRHHRVSILLLMITLFFNCSLASGADKSPGKASEKPSPPTGEALDVALSKMTTDLEEGIDSKTYEGSAVLKVAILPVQSADGMPVSRLGAYVRSTLSIRLIRGKKLTVLDRNTLDKMVHELEFQESELVDPASRKRIGKFLGADVIMASTIFDTGDYVKVTATIYDLTTTLAISAADCRIDRSSIPSFLLRGSLIDNPAPVSIPTKVPEDCLHHPVSNGTYNQTVSQNGNGAYNGNGSHNNGSWNGSAGNLHSKAELPVELELTVLPTEATVAINGEILRNNGSGIYNIVRPEGRYALFVYLDGYRKKSSVLNLIREYSSNKNGSDNLDLTVTLDPLLGYLALNILDGDGSVYDGLLELSLDGELIEDHTRRSLSCSPGQHMVEIAIENYYRIASDVTVSDGEVTEVIVNLVPKPVEPEIGSSMVNSAAMKLMWVPSGRFLMGSPPRERGRMDDEGPVHEVEITHGFWLGKHEVTQRQFRQVMGREHRKKSGKFRPVEGISYEEALQFCKKLSAVEDKRYRLPTEAEWEYACRAGNPPFIYESELGRAAWYRNNSNGRSHNVGKKAENPWGLCDMLGNVKEWCSDFYGPFFSAAMTDPTGPAFGSYRVLKGGSWFSSSASCRPAYRADRADAPYGLVGFRVLCEQ